MNAERWQRVKQVLDDALAVESSERAAFLDRACADNTELRREVESLLASHEQAGTNFLKTPAVDLTATLPAPKHLLQGRRVGVYQILEEIGRGGMGEVYRAVRADGQYEKEVAVKLVRGGLDTASVIERFRNERQILASLDHPNISRLLDGGTTDDGIPYLVMELIEGQPVDQYCDEQRLTVSARLQLFRQVCAAVQFAHQRLVIHRDIKPSNVLVTKEGVPKLLDFGIAKIVAPLHDAQTTMTQAMTPEYASPEQIRGEPITTATDVYSLGVVLYQLLTGRSPYPGDTRSPHKLAQAVCETEPGRPSTVVVKRELVANATAVDPDQISSTREGTPTKLRRRLGGDLDDITMMALRKEPVRRYGSVEQFAEDIRRHLEGLPVLANRGSWRYRAEKFIKRHKVGIGAAAVVAVAVAGGVGTTIREARIADANARRADKRFNDVRKLANSFLFEFHDAIEHLQGSTPARELVVKRALEYLDSLSQEAGGDASLRRELASAYDRVGNVQGAPYRDNLGNYKGALGSLQKAAAIRTQLLASSPQDEDLRSELARDYGEIGDILDAMGDLKTALENYKKGLDILALASQPNSRTKIRTEMLHDHYGMGLSESGDLAGAAGNFRNALAIIDQLIKEDPSDRETVRDKAVTDIHLGNCLKQMRRFPEALAAYRDAYATFQSLIAPGNAQSKRDLGVANEGIADILQRMGNRSEALTIRQTLLEEDVAAQKADPSNALLRQDVYVDYNKLAEVQLSLGELREAAASEREGIALAEREVAANAASSRARKDLQVQYFTLGKILRKANQNRESLSYFEKARAIAESLTKEDPKDQDIRANLSEAEMYLSDTQLTLGNSSGAMAGYLDALSIADSIVTVDPTNFDSKILLAQLNQKLGEYYANHGAKNGERSQRAIAREKALASYRKSLDLWKDLQAHDALGADYNARPSEVAREIAACEAAPQR